MVNPKPNASVTPTGPVVVCGGGTQTLTATGGGTYQWLNNGTPIGGQTSSTYLVTATGNYSCIVTTTATGCFDTSNVVNVQITSTSLTPTITPARTFVCPTGDDTLNVGTGYTSYLWSTNAGSATTNLVSVTASGTYTVTVHNGSCSGTASINITSQTATPTPTITALLDTIFCQGRSVVLVSSAPSNNVWSGGGGTGDTAIYTTTGSYTVTTNNGCGAATSAPISVRANPIPNAAITPAGSTLICNGGSQILTATPSGASYVWIESGNVLSGQTQSTTSATTAGIYSAVVTVNGCSDTSNAATIQVAAPLTPNITATYSTLCPGQSDTLNVGAGYSSYTWNSGLGTTQSIIVTSGATYSITVANGTCTGSASIIVNQGGPTPTPTITVTGSLNICGNDSVILTSSSATNNSWSNSAGTQSITEYSAGIFTVTTAGACGSATSAPDTVTKNAIPSVSAGQDTGACVGTPIVLVASSPVGSTLAWSNGPTTAIDSVTTAAEYYVTVSQNGCSSTDSVHVTFDAVPTASFTVSHDTLTAATGPSYQWYEDGVSIPGANSQVFVATANGTHNYRVAETNGYCIALSAYQLVTVTGISDISQSLSTNIYPNPTNNEVTISYSLTREQELDITVTDLTGRTISRLYSGTQSVGVFNIVTDLSSLAGGIYLVNFNTPEGNLVRKITKE